MNIQSSKFLEQRERDIEMIKCAARINALKEAAHILGRYQVPVGNSPAGELACEWTIIALRECQSEILDLIYK